MLISDVVLHLKSVFFFVPKIGIYIKHYTYISMVIGRPQFEFPGTIISALRSLSRYEGASRMIMVITVMTPLLVS
jgi:ABC-type transport system involved in cytochrome c biogenesis permease component